MVNESPLMMYSSKVEAEHDWGGACFDAQNRGGICAFRIKHVLAIQAFAEYALQQLTTVRGPGRGAVTFANIISEMDGPIADDISHEVSKAMKTRPWISQASRCSFKLAPRCLADLNQVDPSSSFESLSRCGVPHAVFVPQDTYWTTSLFEEISYFFNGTTNAVGKPLRLDAGASIGGEAGVFAYMGQCVADSTMGLGPMYAGAGTSWIGKAQRRFAFSWWF